MLKQRCDLLGSSIINAVKKKDVMLLSDDLKESIGWLVGYVSSSACVFNYSNNLLTRGIWDTLKAANKEKGKGFAAYILAEDDAGTLRDANQKLDRLLQCFWICFPIS